MQAGHMSSVRLLTPIALTAFAERHPHAIRSQKKSRFFATDFQIAWPLEERSCPGYERHNAHDSFCDQCEMTVGPRDL